MYLGNVLRDRKDYKDALGEPADEVVIMLVKLASFPAQADSAYR
jgi:hypothetical protein